MTAAEDTYPQAIRKAKQALNRGERSEARHWAQLAAQLSPNQADPWLIMAATGSPEASIEYLKRVQSIDPNNERVKAGMLWAQNRLSNKPAPLLSPLSKSVIDLKLNKYSFIHFKSSPIWWGILFLFFVLIGQFSNWDTKFIINQKSSPPKSILISETQFNKETRTPTATTAPSETPLPTSTPLPTETPIPSPTQMSTATQTKVTIGEKKNKTKKQLKTTKKVRSVKAPAVIHRPTQVGINERWIDIDLSSQRAYAYIGDEMSKGFIVSTGTWQHPTVTGVFHIYVKYRSASMTGPGYHLPNVPYVMYFYKDYGLHGTYWHNNFGRPMSHGCVNFSTPDSAWLYNFASIGTVVNIHK